MTDPTKPAWVIAWERKYPMAARNIATDRDWSESASRARLARNAFEAGYLAAQADMKRSSEESES